jgi:pantothenate kinase
MIHRTFDTIDRLLVLGRGPSARDPRIAASAHDGVAVIDPTYALGDVYTGEPTAVMIGDHSPVEAQVAMRYHAAPDASKPLLLHGELVRPIGGDMRAIDVRPLLRDAGLYDGRDGDVYPTTGVFLVMVAAALGKRATIAGIDLYRHPSGRMYRTRELELGYETYPSHHSHDCDAKHLARAAQMAGDRFDWFGVAAAVVLAGDLLRTAGKRTIIGIAGIPGSGKSTFARLLVGELNRREPNVAALVPMDGFHLSNQQLEAMGRRDAKGAPDTFDAGGYIALLRRLRDAAQPVAYPIYDRRTHEPAPGPRVEPATRIVITEGNYLLLDKPPWSQLAGALDACWWLDCPADIARERLLARHMQGGRTPDDAQRHYARCDVRNTDRILNGRRGAQRVVRAII